MNATATRIDPLAGFFFGKGMKLPENAGRSGTLVTIGNHSSLSAQNDHGYCLLCGERNPWSMKIAFEADKDGHVSAKFQAHRGLRAMTASSTVA